MAFLCKLRPGLSQDVCQSWSTIHEVLLCKIRQGLSQVTAFLFLHSKIQAGASARGRNLWQVKALLRQGEGSLFIYSKVQARAKGRRRFSCSSYTKISAGRRERTFFFLQQGPDDDMIFSMQRLWSGELSSYLEHSVKFLFVFAAPCDLWP